MLTASAVECASLARAWTMQIYYDFFNELKWMEKLLRNFQWFCFFIFIFMIEIWAIGIIQIGCKRDWKTNKILKSNSPIILSTVHRTWRLKQQTCSFTFSQCFSFNKKFLKFLFRKLRDSLSVCIKHVFVIWFDGLLISLFASL